MPVPLARALLFSVLVLVPLPPAPPVAELVALPPLPLAVAVAPAMVMLGREPEPLPEEAWRWFWVWLPPLAVMIGLMVGLTVLALVPVTSPLRALPPVALLALSRLSEMDGVEPVPIRCRR